jgi:hypothetical protein
MGRIGSAATESESYARFVRFQPACTFDFGCAPEAIVPIR